MSFSWKLFKTRFARRLFIYFLLSALVPVALLSFLTYLNFSTSQIEQIHDHMRFTAKTLGMHLYENLVHIKSEFQQLGSDIERNRLAQKPGTLDDHHLATLFDRIIVVSDYKTQLSLHGEPDKDFFLSTEQKQLLDYGNILLSQIDLQQRSYTRMMMGLKISDNDVRYLYADIGEHFFNAIADNLPDNFQICISSLDNKPIYCPLRQDLLLVLKKHPQLERLHSGQVSINAANVEYLAYFWSIFLKSAFIGENWRLSVVIPSATNYNPHQSLTQTLYIILLTLLLAAFFSSMHLHRQLFPLEALSRAATSIFKGDLGSRVHVASSDEFATVVNAFNAMADRMEQQIDSLSNLAEIDRSILSSTNSQYLVGKILSHIKFLLKSQQIKLAIIALDDDKISIKSLLDNSSAAKYLHFLGGDFQRLDYTADKRFAIYRNREEMPKNIQDTLHDMEQSATVFPIFLQGKLNALVIASSIKELDVNLVDIKHARDFVDRLAVVLTSASWEQRLYQKTHFDQVTRLPNRNLLLDRLDQALRRSKRDGSMVAVLFIDLNRFKVINDTLSHAAGDIMLLEIAQRMAYCASETDSIARFGGDKFVGVLADIVPMNYSLSNIIDTVEYLLAEISKPFKLDNHELSITASIGISIFPSDARSRDDLIRFSEAAMYHAKSLGTNTYHFYSDEVNSRNVTQLVLENDLRRALKNNELELYFQPQVSVQNGELLGVEALVRWNHKDLGTLSPNTFIPLARNTGEIRAFDLWVMEQACRQIRTWLDKNIDIKRVAINLSADQFQKADILVSLDKYLDDYKIAPNLLELEITEDTLMKNLDTTRELLRALNNRGVKLAIDDFGTGYSSLNYLAKFPLQYLKIDHSFIREVTLDKNMSAIVSATIALAHSLKLEVIAEGVEMAEQLIFLREIDCDIIQGFLVSKPLNVDDFERWLRDYHPAQLKLG